MNAFETLQTVGLNQRYDSDQAIQWVYDELKGCLLAGAEVAGTFLSMHTGEKVDVFEILTEALDSDELDGQASSLIFALINHTLTGEQVRDLATYLVGEYEGEIRQQVELANKELYEDDYSAATAGMEL